MDKHGLTDESIEEAIDSNEAIEPAARRTSDLFRQAAEKADVLRARAAGAVAEAKDPLSGQAADATQAGLSRVTALIDEFNAALPVLSEAGYAINGMEIQLTLPPRIVASFSYTGSVSEDTIDALAEQHRERRLAVMTMRSLRQAQALQSRVSVAGLQPAGLSVEVGLIPTVIVRYE